MDKDVIADGDYHVYTLDMSTLASWEGQITTLLFHPFDVHELLSWITSVSCEMRYQMGVEIKTSDSDNWINTFL